MVQAPRDNAQLKAFVQGATAAATGALSGAVVVLAKRAIFDIPTAAISWAVLFSCGGSSCRNQ
jgi:chromate transporter